MRGVMGRGEREERSRPSIYIKSINFWLETELGIDIERNCIIFTSASCKDYESLWCIFEFSRSRAARGGGRRSVKNDSWI